MNEEIRKIDLNTADQETLDDLPGIGPALAARIVAYRENVHPFEEVIELTAVPGISEKMVREIEHLLEVKATDLRSAAENQPTDDFQPGVILTVETVTEMGEVDEETAVAPEPELELETDAPAPELDETEPEIIMEAETWEQEEDLPAEDDEDADDAFIVPYDPPPLAPTIVQQGYSLRALMASSLLTAVVTILLTLGLLYLLNGTLYFASDARADRIEARGDEALQGSLNIAAALGTLTSRVNGLTGRINGLEGQQQRSAQNVTAVESDIAALQESTGALQESTGALDERLTGVAAAAANFDQFLDGLRDLLLALQGEPTPPDAPEDAAAPEPEAEPEATVIAPPPTPTATATPAVAPTRTPRPTATPLP
jgi:competence ComEA-like helix-hairpin-helix protein